MQFRLARHSFEPARYVLTQYAWRIQATAEGGLSAGAHYSSLAKQTMRKSQKDQSMFVGGRKAGIHSDRTIG